MPPGHGDDGLAAAIEVRQRRPDTSVLVLSQYHEERYAAELMADGADGVGHLLKERVGNITWIFEKLEIDAVDSERRRVHAVLRFLREN